MKRVWVIGASGLLGQSICNSVRGRDGYWLFTKKFNWDNVSILNAELEESVNYFFSAIDPGDQWYIYWAAGVGAMHSKRADLKLETESLILLLKCIEKFISSAPDKGCFSLASSAGAIYGGCNDYEINENSNFEPLCDYGTEKLIQERILQEFSDKHEKFKTLIARFSTLYGPNQSFGKRQGLISHIARHALRREPIKIFVPLDTIRDYYYADDAAESLHSFVTSNAIFSNNRYIVKIFASENPVSISAIISIYNKLMFKKIRFVLLPTEATSLYSPRIAYKSIVKCRCCDVRTTSLLEGCFNVLKAERRLYLNANTGEFNERKRV